MAELRRRCSATSGTRNRRPFPSDRSKPPHHSHSVFGWETREYDVESLSQCDRPHISSYSAFRTPLRPPDSYLLRLYGDNSKFSHSAVTVTRPFSTNLPFLNARMSL